MQDVFVLFTFFLLGVIFLIGLYLYYQNLDREFSDDTFVIKLRNGKVSTTLQGGSTKCLPLIDDIILIPTKTQMTEVEIRNEDREEEKNFDLKGIVSWSVKDPLDAFSKLSWNPEKPNYAETIIKNMTESKLKLMCEDKSLTFITYNENVLVNSIMTELRYFFTSCSITITALSLTDINRL